MDACRGHDNVPTRSQRSGCFSKRSLNRPSHFRASSCQASSVKSRTKKRHYKTDAHRSRCKYSTRLIDLVFVRIDQMRECRNPMSSHVQGEKKRQRQMERPSQSRHYLCPNIPKICSPSTVPQFVVLYVWTYPSPYGQVAVVHLECFCL